ncbi:hypothetical protein QET93_012265 [Akkermansia sp. N21116]|jgi:hypothetical protein|uniref:hypothetical protein n=1 Tax=Akkermansia sp. N21116 TaxID=3040764 RepID=UPI002AC930B1|nr:hypothetical protein [Akkermansia sp. N21116]WPX40300.1 hypothetical protein QET93_012265 [Akkermansia sp. N21116]
MMKMAILFFCATMASPLAMADGIWIVPGDPNVPKEHYTSPLIDSMDDWVMAEDEAYSGAPYYPKITKKDARRRMIAQIKKGLGLNDYRVCDGSYESPLLMAVGMKDPDILRLLLESGADPNHEGNCQLMAYILKRYPLVFDGGATYKIFLSLFEILLQHGWDMKLNEAYVFGFAPQDVHPLSAAVNGMVVPYVRFFLDHGADPLLKDKSGNNALLYCEKKLAEAKANNKPDKLKTMEEIHRMLLDHIKAKQSAIPIADEKP